MKRQLAPSFFPLVVALTVLSGCSDGPHSPPKTFAGEFIGTWGSGDLLDGQLASPSRVAIDPQRGRIYVTDWTLRDEVLIEVFSQDGAFIERWNISQAYGPLSQLVVAPDGTLYGSILRVGQIIHLSSEGSFLETWGGGGSDAERFYAGDIAIGSDGYFYVSDPMNDNINVFDAARTKIRSWGQSAPVQLANAGSIALDDSGFLYVADTFQIRKFTLQGEEIGSWGYARPGVDAYSSNVDLTVDTNGDVIVMERQLGVERFTSDGEIVSWWTGEGEQFAALSLGPSIAIHPDRGTIYTLGLREFGIQEYDRTGRLVNHFGDPPSTVPGQFYFPSQVAVARDGSVIVRDPFRFQRFSETGVFLNEWTLQTASSDFGMTTTSDGAILASVGWGRVRKYSLTGDALGEWDWSGDYPYSVQSMDADERGRIWVTDSYKNRVMAFSVEGRVVESWGVPGEQPGQLWRPQCVAAASDLVVVCDHNGVQLFDPHGRFLETLAQGGTVRLAMADRKLYMSDSQGDVTVMDLQHVGLGTATVIAELRHEGPVTEGWLPPRNLAASEMGDVYVLSPRTGQVFQYRVVEAPRMSPTSPSPW